MSNNKDLFKRYALNTATIIAGFLLISFVYTLGQRDGKVEGVKAATPRAYLAGQLSACNTIFDVLKAGGEANPMVGCEEFQGEAAVGFPGHADAPHFHLNGKQF